MNKYLKISLVATLLFCIGCTRPPIYSTEYNLDFEYAKNDSIPTQWIISDPNTTGYSVHVDTLVKQHGHSSARLQWDTAAMARQGGIQQYWPGRQFAGKEVEVSGWTRAEGLSDDGHVFLWLMVADSTGGLQLRADTLRTTRGTADWTRLAAKLTVPNDCTNLAIAGVLAGRGTVWFDNFEIRTDGARYEDKEIPALKTELSDKDKEELRRYVHPLRTCEPDGGDTHDLDILRQLIGNCKVVGLGENTHGTSEIYLLKNRIFRYLAENEGFDILALEAGMAESRRVNDYTATGTGDPKQSIRGLWLWPWWTEEMLSLIEWMRTYNTPEPKIAFTGVDMQFPQFTMRELQRCLGACPSAGRQVGMLSDKLQTYLSKPGPELAAEIGAGLDSLAADKELAVLSDEERAWIRQYMTLVRRFLDKNKTTYWRDRGMAANLQWIMRQNPNSRIVLWAHDLHIGRSAMFPMGTFLKERFGDDYKTFGFVLYEGSYTAWKNKLDVFALPAPEPGTLEYALGQLHEPIFMLDLERMRKENASAMKWIDHLEYREITSTPGILFQQRITETFDYLFFIRTASASHILNF